MNISEQSYKIIAKKCRDISTESNLAVFCSIDHKIIYVDTQLEEVCGFSREDLIGENLNILIPRDMHHTHQNKLESFADNDTVARTMSRGRSVRLRTKNNKSVPVEITLFKFKDLIPEGMVVAAVMLPLPVTDKEDLHKTKEITETTVIDEDGKIRQFKSITEYVNNNWKQVRLILVIASLGFLLWNAPRLLERYFDYRIQLEQQK